MELQATKQMFLYISTFSLFINRKALTKYSRSENVYSWPFMFAYFNSDTRLCQNIFTMSFKMELSRIECFVIRIPSYVTPPNTIIVYVTLPVSSFCASAVEKIRNKRLTSNTSINCMQFRNALKSMKKSGISDKRSFLTAIKFQTISQIRVEKHLLIRRHFRESSRQGVLVEFSCHHF